MWAEILFICIQGQHNRTGRMRFAK